MITATSDHIVDNSYVPLHWDSIYKPSIPELQIFYCLSLSDNNLQWGDYYRYDKIINYGQRRFSGSVAKVSVSYSIA